MAGIIIVGTQWGDEGKGKATDHLGGEVDVVIKFNGGNNAGHTVVVDGQSYALHLLPSGVLSPGVTPVIGSGVVIDPRALFEEVDLMESRGVDVSKLKVAANAHVIPTYNRLVDAASEKQKGSAKIGTTGRGIGPTYSDKMNRVGVRVQDLLDEDVLRSRLEAVLPSKRQEVVGSPEELSAERAAELPSEVVEGLDVDATLETLLEYGDRLRPYVVDTSLLVNDALDSGETVLFEAGQAAMLDIDHGTYPYVTSSATTAGGALASIGVGPTKIDRIVGVAKAYTTRVGEGPFPAELFGDEAEELRELGGEYGVTTGRPRRVGWLDTVIVRFASRINGLTDIALTKLDVLDDFEEIPVCVGYRIDGEVVTEMPPFMTDFEQAEPVYEVLPGWQEDITEVRKFEDLPQAAQDYVLFVEDQAGTKISIVGVGAGREEVILRD